MVLTVVYDQDQYIDNVLKEVVEKIKKNMKKLKLFKEFGDKNSDKIQEKFRMPKFRMPKLVWGSKKDDAGEVETEEEKEKDGVRELDDENVVSVDDGTQDLDQFSDKSIKDFEIDINECLIYLQDLTNHYITDFESDKYVAHSYFFEDSDKKEIKEILKETKERIEDIEPTIKSKMINKSEDLNNVDGSVQVVFLIFYIGDVKNLGIDISAVYTKGLKLAQEITDYKFSTFNNRHTKQR